MKKKITFFYTDHLEKNTWKNLKKKTYERGFATVLSKDLSKNVEIGFYNHDRSIKNNAKISKKRYKDVTILPPKSDIFTCLSAADLLVTDESSVLYEAMFFNMPTVIPSDWKMRINNMNKPRNIIPSKYAYINCSKKQLYPTVKSISQKNLFYY